MRSDVERTEWKNNMYDRILKIVSRFLSSTLALYLAMRTIKLAWYYYICSIKGFYVLLCVTRQKEARFANRRENGIGRYLQKCMTTIGTIQFLGSLNNPTWIYRQFFLHEPPASQGCIVVVVVVAVGCTVLSKESGRFNFGCDHRSRLRAK